MARLPRHLMPEWQIRALDTSADPQVYYPDIILPEPAEVDSPDSLSTELVYNPDNAVLDINRPDLNLIFTQTLGARVKEFYLHGTGFIWTGGALALGLAGGIITWIVLDVMSLVVAIHAWWIVNSSAVIGALLFVVTLIIMLGRHDNPSGTVVVKGCPKGPTPGAITIRR